MNPDGTMGSSMPAIEELAGLGMRHIRRMVMRKTA
jgi:hypothetical protein